MPANNHIRRQQQPVSDALRDSELPPLLQRLYANRHIQQPDELDYSLAKLLPWDGLANIQAAAAAVAERIRQQQTIVIVGDYDADGATSTAVMLRALRSFGHQQQHFVVPNRFDFGYGLSPEIVDVCRQYQPDLIITVDNGIASIAGVERANALGIPVVITDHHLAADTLPAALAIVNPNQPGCNFASKSLAGVGVAFYLMLAVRAGLKQAGWFDERDIPNMATLLDLVALGTVADVVPLDANNRLLVDQGLRRIRAGKGCAGIEALLKVAGRTTTSACAQDFGFVVGPRLNAAGRLEDMSLGIECLLSDDPGRAEAIAFELDAINRQRRSLQGEMQTEANRQVDAMLAQLDGDDALPAALCLYQPEWHQGIVGLLASRIKERVHRPVIAFAPASAGSSELKGSARSIRGIHIRDAIDRVDKRAPGLIPKFGGHAMAAGLSLAAGELPAFTELLQQEILAMVDADVFTPEIISDGAVDAADLNLATAELLRFSGPWGQQFSEPLFDDSFEIADWRVLADKHLKLRLRQGNEGPLFDAIAFNHTDEDLPAGDRLHAVFRLGVNEYNGRRNLQLVIEQLHGVEN